MHGAREGWKRDRGEERARERERERERERRGGRPMACGVRGCQILVSAHVTAQASRV